MDESLYLFRQCTDTEPEQVYDLIRGRMRWMDENGIRQWNVTEYDTIYPLSYYQAMQDRLWVLVRGPYVVAAGILLENDDRWHDDVPAYYLHNFVARTDCPGAGSRFLQAVEALALQNGKSYLRLDSADDNPRLAAYYGRHGFEPAGSCCDGAYHGTLRQKRITAV